MAVSKQVKAATNKTKVISTGKLNAHGGGSTKMFGKQSVKATRKA